MKKVHFLGVLIFASCLSFTAMSQIDTFGIWKADVGLPAASYPNWHGAMGIVQWDALQPTRPTNSTNEFTWTVLNNELKRDTTKPIVLLIWIWSAGNNNVFPPGWLFSDPNTTNCGNISNIYNPKIAKVKLDTNGSFAGTWAPPFGCDNFKFYLKRMIDSVKRRILYVQSLSLPATVDVSGDGISNYKDETIIKGYKQVISVQVCLGSTGDFPSYKKYAHEAEPAPVDFVKYYYEMSHYYDSVYKNNAGGIRLLHNPGNDNFSLVAWIMGETDTSKTHVPIAFPPPAFPWLKMGDVGHGYQLNGEQQYYDALQANRIFSKHSGQYIQSRSEMATDVTTAGWWAAKPGDPGRPYRNMMALFGSALHFGLSMSNQLGELDSNIAGHNPYSTAFDFYNRHAGLQDTGLATYGFCMLRDGLDASNIARFSELDYGKYNGATTTELKSRFIAIKNSFSVRGARIDDIENAVGGALGNRGANGINDVGDSIIQGNYQQYLSQIAADATSVGYWNVQSSVDSISVYGRFARAFEHTTHKDTMYFDIDNKFLGTRPASGYNVTLKITYLDSGNTGTIFRVYYDSKAGPNQLAKTDTIKNSKKWITDTIVITNGYFGNRLGTVAKADFRILNLSDGHAPYTNFSNVIFSLIEINKNPGANPIANKTVEKPNVPDVILISPNPSDDRFIIATKDKSIISSVTLYDKFGKQVLHKKINATSTTILRSEIKREAGVYFAAIILADGTIVKYPVELL